MLDIKFIRENPEKVQDSADKKGYRVSIKDLLMADERRRELQQQVDSLRERRNAVASQMKGGRPSPDLIAEGKSIKEDLMDLEAKFNEVDAGYQAQLNGIPNVIFDDVPEGGEEDSVEIKAWGEKTTDAKDHLDYALSRDWVDFERGAKVTGARFTFYRGLGARLERALINFMLDVHTREHGYTEFFPPFIANKESMTGTGQLPKFAEDMFKLEGLDYYLIPTAEVPITNLHRGEILDAKDLPRYYTAYSACFRAEAGSAGRDTRGIIRQHQFNKVEMVKFCLPENSYDELEKLVGNAERILQLLELPYRVITLCSGDIGFSSAKTYDLEVWLPSFNTYREISSCSNFEDFQARRADIKFRRDAKSKPEYVHTLNGSGLAIGRTVAAILENYQQADGSVLVPKVLRAFMGVDVIQP